MKMLAKRDFATPLRFESRLRVRWGTGPSKIIPLPGREALRFKIHEDVRCEQEVTLEKPHVVDRAYIVQLDPEEAAHLGLKSALGVVEGRRLGDAK